MCLKVNVKTLFPPLSLLIRHVLIHWWWLVCPENWLFTAFLSLISFYWFFFLLHAAADNLTKTLLHHLPLCYATEITGFMTRPHQQFITYVLSGNELPVCGIGARVHTCLEDPVQLFVVGLFFPFPSAVKIRKEEKYMLYICHTHES